MLFNIGLVLFPVKISHQIDTVILARKSRRLNIPENHSFRITSRWQQGEHPFILFRGKRNPRFLYFHTIHGEKPRLSIAPTPSSLLFKRLSCDFHTKKKIIGIGMDIFDPDFAIGEHLYYTRKQEKKQEMSRNDIQKIRGREMARAYLL